MNWEKEEDGSWTAYAGIFELIVHDNGSWEIMTDSKRPLSGHTSDGARMAKVDVEATIRELVRDLVQALGQG